MSRWSSKSSIDLMLIGVVLIWGANYTVAKFGMQTLSAEVFTLTRFLMVLPVLFGLVYMTERNVKIRVKDIPAFLLAALVGISLYQTLFVASLRYTTASNSSLLIAMSPLFTVIGLLLTKKEKAKPTLVIGSFVAIMGVFMIKGLGDIPFQFSWISLRGDIIALCASILFGIYPFPLTRLQKTYTALTITLYTAIFGSIFLALYSGADWLRTDFMTLPVATWGSLLFAAYPVTAYSLVVWNYGIEKLGASRVMPYMYLVPVTAIVIAMLWIDEGMNIWQACGAFFILLGVGVVRQGEQWLHGWKQRSSSKRQQPFS